MTDPTDKSRDLDRRIAQAPTEVAPPTDLWPGIVAAIHAETTKLDERAARLDPERAPPAELWHTIRARAAAES